MKKFTKDELQAIHDSLCESGKAPAASGQLRNAYKKMEEAYENYLILLEKSYFGWAYQAGYEAGYMDGKGAK